MRHRGHEVKDKKFNEPEFWDDLVLEYGPQAEGADYSPRSHFDRMRAIRTVLGDCQRWTVFDAPCGTAFLDRALGPFAAYIGMDFSPEAVKIASIGSTAAREVAVGDLREGLPTWVPEVDWVTCIGFAPACKKMLGVDGLIGLVEQFLSITREGVIIDWAWIVRCDLTYLLRVSIDDVVNRIVKKGYTVEVLAGYVDHEFMTVIR